MRIRKFANRIKKAVKVLFSDKQEDNSRALILDFQKRKNEIIKKNEEKIINRLMETVRDQMLKTDGLLISDNQARHTAYQMFITAKEMGQIDSMNNVVRKQIR